jgi:hypothetical protein
VPAVVALPHGLSGSLVLRLVVVAVVIDGVGCRCALIDLDRVYRPAAKVEVLLRAGDGGADRWCLSQK